MVIRAFVGNEYAFAADGVDIGISMAEVDERGFPLKTHAVLRMMPQNETDRTIRFQWHIVLDHERAIELQFPHIIRLPEGVGQALLEALSRNYHGSADVHRMDADLGRERARRDEAENRIWNILDRMTTGLAMESNADPVAMQLAQYLPALSLAVSRTTDPPPVGSPPLQFHSNTLCRGHMPWDMRHECTE
jgi:hypothetical protein